ncbi:MAG: hypothetical protein OER97_12185, partial [Gammaproteobacteria bacterium]|nr:hypothetical protein [Gammaproteobacteria bacterium]
MRTQPLFKIIAVVGAISVLIVATIVAHNFSTGPLPVLERELRDALHAPGFALITLFLYLSLRWGANPHHPFTMTFAICASLAIIAEGSQIMGSRDAALGDLAADGLGIFAGLLIGGLVLGVFRSASRLGSYRAIAIVCGTLLSLLVILPLADASYAIAAQRSALPQLASFEARWEKRLYSGSLDRGLKIVPSPSAAFPSGERTALLD